MPGHTDIPLPRSAVPQSSTGCCPVIPISECYCHRCLQMCRSGKHSLQDAKCIMDEMWEEYIRSKQDSKDTERLVNRAILEHHGTPTWLRFLVFSFGFHAEHSCHRRASQQPHVTRLMGRFLPWTILDKHIGGEESDVRLNNSGGLCDMGDITTVFSAWCVGPVGGHVANVMAMSLPKGLWRRC